VESATLTARAAKAARRRRGVRALLAYAGPVVYALALTTAVVVRGLPTSRDALFVWILLGLLAFSLTDPRRWLRGVLLEWLPFGAILFAYDRLRGSADEIFSAYYLPQLRADELLFAGTVPTVWLQERLWGGAGAIDWIDYASWVVYLTHFFGTLVVAASLWLFARGHFRRYMAMVCVLAAAGFVTYALFPAAPPWLASEAGHLPPTDRIVRFVSADVPISFFGAIWESGADYANDVAAVPSLHAAYALLISLFLWRLAPGGWRVALALYPVAMGFALVYTAEHYVSDILLGWLYAAAALLAVDAVAKRRAAPG
jgi:membrane-associated phospholipid phosphatase